MLETMNLIFETPAICSAMAELNLPVLVELRRLLELSEVKNFDLRCGSLRVCLDWQPCVPTLWHSPHAQVCAQLSICGAALVRAFSKLLPPSVLTPPQ